MAFSEVSCALPNTTQASSDFSHGQRKKPFGLSKLLSTFSLRLALTAVVGFEVISDNDMPFTISGLGRAANSVLAGLVSVR